MNKKNSAKWLVITDLDGTLLDHDTYSFSPALPSLKQLSDTGIPVIINSSKTASEIKTLKKALKNTHPFIVENGSAILTPLDYFSRNPPPTTNDHYEEYILGQKRQDVLTVIDHLKKQFPNDFVSYSQCTISDIMTMTSLSQSDAAQSADRYYTEPVKWLGSDDKKQKFIYATNELGVYILQGGRFLHLMGDTDKGRASIQLAEKYTQYYQQDVTTIALGDSHNDIAMLEAADIAVVIRSAHYPPPEFTHKHKIVSTAYGPQGWHESIQQIIFNGNH